MSSQTALTRTIVRALDRAVAGDKDAVAEAIADIGMQGEAAVFTALVGWSSVTLLHMTGDITPDPDAFYELEVTERATGRQVSSDRIGADDHQSAIQLATLYGNRDTPHIMALTEAACGKDGGVSLMVATVQLAAVLTRAGREPDVKGGGNGRTRHG